jgi:hypothetical protein
MSNFLKEKTMKNIYELSLCGQGSRHNEKGGGAKRRTPSKTTTTVVTFLTVLLTTLFGGSAYAQPVLSLNKSGTQTLNAAYGYDSVSVEIEVEVENIGNAATGALTFTLSGANAEKFVLSANGITDLAAGDKISFTVSPEEGLTVNNGVKYKATVTVSDGGSISETFDVEFEVNKRTATMDDFVYEQKSVDYDGAVHAADVKSKFADMIISIVYYNGVTWTATPIEAYSYIVAIYVQEDDNFNYVAAGDLWFGNIFTIKKALLPLTTDDFNVSGPTTVTYDGLPHTPVITAKDHSLNVSIVYCDWNNGQTWSSSPPVDAGNYVVVVYASNPTNQNYQSTAVWGFSNLIIEKVPLTLTTDNFNFSATETIVTYDGSAHAPDITAKDPNLNVSIVYCDWYNGQTWSSSPPVNAGTYIVVASASNRNYQSANVWGFSNLIIEKAPLTLTADDLEEIDPRLADGGTLTFEYTGYPIELATPKLKGAFAGLLGIVSLTYDGNADQPVFPGKYAVTATIVDGKNYKSEGVLLGYIEIQPNLPTTPVIPRKVTLDVSPHFVSDPAPGSFYVNSFSNLEITLTPRASLPEGYKPRVTTDRVLPDDNKGGVKVTAHEDGTYTVRIAYIIENTVVTVETVAQPNVGDVGNEVASASAAIRVWSYGRQLYLSAGATAGQAYVYNVSGVLVKTIPFASGETHSVVLPAGIYVVRAEGKVFKILVKA